MTAEQIKYLRSEERRAKNRVWQQQYRARHPERVRELTRKYQIATAARRRERDRERYRKNPKFFRDKGRWTWIKAQYGLTKAQYLEMFAEQGGKCAICGLAPEEAEGKSRKYLHVDHDHLFQNVRGLLCHKCNLFIGHANNSEAILEAAIRYLRKHRGHLEIICMSD